MRLSPENEVAEENVPIEQCVTSWTGRWILCAGTVLYTDFSVLIGLYYNNEFVSNSFALMLDELKRRGKKIHYKKINVITGMALIIILAP